jgi:hypothetical protein
LHEYAKIHQSPTGSYSAITLTDAGGRVVLDRGAKLTLTAGEGGQATPLSTITAGAVSARLTGAFTGLTPDAAIPKQPVLSVAHRGGDLAEVNIIANNADVILGKSPKAVFTQ